MAVRDLLTNWAAAVRLPFVHLGLAADFWCGLGRYGALDPGAGSTFFVIPVEGYAGRTSGGPAPRHRAARYGARDIADELRGLMAAGCEIGVHGIDAWLDSAAGRDERGEIARITGAPEIGIRMHWLYGDEESPRRLEQAGFTYDSTSGYNDAVGYRAGTTQVFKPLGVQRLLELPLHAMDTALLSGRRLGLSPGEAQSKMSAVVDHAVRFGGIVTINWHDRSVAPERLWGRVYGELIRDLRGRGAWFPTAARAVAWFRYRRAARFQSVDGRGGVIRARVCVDRERDLPGLRLRVHGARDPRQRFRVGAGPSPSHVDVPMHETLDAEVRV
jgi:hypothetical protein